MSWLGFLTQGLGDDIADRSGGPGGRRTVPDGLPRTRDQAIAAARQRVAERAAARTSARARRQRRKASRKPFLGRVSGADLRAFTGQLGLMLDTGTPLSEALDALARQTTRPRLAKALGQVHREVNGGTPLSEALDSHPAIFSDFYMATVRAGEATGTLTEVFQRLETHIYKREALLNSVRSALTYPTILVLLASSAVLFLLSFVLPKFQTIFSAHAALLPLPTRILLDTAAHFRENWYWVALSVVTLLTSARRYVTSRHGKPVVDRVVLALPVVGRLVKRIQTAVLLRMVGAMLEAGVELLDAMDVAQRACSNSRFRKLVTDVSAGILQGKSLAEGFAKSPLISPTVKQMIATGEKSGALSTVMTKMADYLDEQAEHQLKRLSTLFEPMVIIGMGAVIGYIALAVLLPLFKLSSAVRGGA